MKKICIPKELISQINSLRQKMVKIGLEKGLSSPETVSYSQELDKLIYRYQFLKKNGDQ